MTLTESELDKIQLLMIENNKSLVKDLEDVFLSKRKAFQYLMMFVTSTIVLVAPRLQPLLSWAGVNLK